MSLGGAARRLLDPWAGLVLAALIVLAVVILLATPGPWRAIGGEDAPVTLQHPPTSDVAVYVLAGPAAARCTAVVWLHVDHRHAALTAILIPPEIRCAVAGGGYAPVRGLVTDLDAAAASEALGGAIGVRFAGWATVDRAALVKLFTAAYTSAEGREGRQALRAALEAFSRSADDVGELRLQHDALQRVLRALPHEGLKSNAVVNYVLGSDEIATDLDLRAVSSVVKTWRAVESRQVAAGVAAAVVETCGPAASWRLDRSRLESLRMSFSLGLTTPATAPRVTFAERSAEVLVVAPRPLGGDPFATDLQAALAGNGALPVRVSAVTLGDAGAVRVLSSLVARRRPLAVVLVPRVVGSDEPPDVAEELEAMVAALDIAYQPCVIVGGAEVGDDELATAIGESGAPVVAVDEAGSAATAPPPTLGVLFANDEARREAARLVAATVARACWPAYLAPVLPGTVLEFSYAARRATEVALAGTAAVELQSWLVACGFSALEADETGRETSATAIIAYRPGSRRAALTTAGDLAWPAATLVRDPAAPAAVTVVRPAD